MPKIRLQPGLCPKHHWGAYSAPPHSLAGFRGRKEMGGEETGGEGPVKLHIPGSFFHPSPPPLKDELYCVKLGQRLQIEDIITVLQCNRLTWYHLENDKDYAL